MTIVMTRYGADGSTIVNQRTIANEDASPWLVQWLTDRTEPNYVVQVVLENADGTHVVYTCPDASHAAPPAPSLSAVPERSYATGRDESEPCQAGTDGCAIDHGTDEGGCATW